MESTNLFDDNSYQQPAPQMGGNDLMSGLSDLNFGDFSEQPE